MEPAGKRSQVNSGGLEGGKWAMTDKQDQYNLSLSHADPRMSTGKEKSHHVHGLQGMQCLK